MFELHNNCNKLDDEQSKLLCNDFNEMRERFFKFHLLFELHESRTRLEFSYFSGTDGARAFPTETVLLVLLLKIH